MPAFQALASASSTMIAAGAATQNEIYVQNLGPNPIYVEISAAATVAGSYQIPAGQSFRLFRPGRFAVNVIAATADQVSPADTRWIG